MLRGELEIEFLSITRFLGHDVNCYAIMIYNNIIRKLHVNRRNS